MGFEEERRVPEMKGRISRGTGVGGHARGKEWIERDAMRVIIVDIEINKSFCRALVFDV